MSIAEKYSDFSPKIYFWLLTLLAVSLPFSPFLISLCQILLLVNWILQSNWKLKLTKMKQHKSLFVFMAIFLIHILWFPINNDIKFGLEDLKIKLPLLILPLIIATSEPLEVREIRILLRFFIGAVVIGTFISIAVFYGFTSHKVKDVREISIFISHIRFSLLIVISILTILHWIKSEGRVIVRHHILYILLIIWMVFFLFLLKSLTGVIILFITTFILILILLDTIENQYLKVGLILIMYAIPFFSVLTILNAYNIFFDDRDGDLKHLEKFTAKNHAYINDTTSFQIENGHRVWIYYCKPELEREWNRRSHIKYNSNDLKDQFISNTLIRYMTSKGLRKDSAGVWQLSNRDIINVQHGMTNFIFEKTWSIYPRIYEVIWEIHNYSHTGSANKQSLIQRFVYSKIAISYIKENFWFGVGSGNIPESYKEYYKTHDTGLSPQWQWHTHNQFLRMFMAFGVIGFLIFLIAFILPPFMENRWPSYYFLMIFLIIFLSFLNEDTLETQVGVTFSAFFYSLFLWGSHKRLL